MKDLLLLTVSVLKLGFSKKQPATKPMKPKVKTLLLALLPSLLTGRRSKEPPAIPL